jgi:hypothetical protein
LRHLNIRETLRGCLLAKRREGLRIDKPAGRDSLRV